MLKVVLVGATFFNLFFGCGSVYALTLKVLESTQYGDAIKGGIEDLKSTGSLITIETELYKYLLKESILLLHQHPLSIDVILGFMFAKDIEIRNLRIIIKGKQLGLDNDFIEKQLVF
ncbi:MAG: V-type ATPase subunit [Nanoarchaeota archaeon]|nr:V-type ATPase subunit [Nanoarchaeota archaeon]